MTINNESKFKEIPDTKPQWWKQNEKIREQLGIDELGPYVPPKFNDGVYTHRVVPKVEKKYNCSLKFISKNFDENSAWEIRVNGEQIMIVERRRDQNGNNTYGIDSNTFVTAVEEAVLSE